MNANLLDHLMDAGYDPLESEPDGDYYELVVSGIGSISVRTHEGEAVVYVFDGYKMCDWEVTCSPGTPDAAIVAVLESAEDELAQRRGGPITNRQIQARQS